MRKLLAVCLLFCFIEIVTAQNIGIGITTPNASAILDVSSTTRGLLMPRMTTAQRNAISFPARGLQTVNTDDGCLDLFDGSAWTKNCGLKETGTAILPPGNWIKRAERSLSVGYQFGNGFAIGNKIYYTALNTNSTEFLEYDITTKIWTTKAPFAGEARTGGISFSIGSKGYIGLGNSYLSGIKNDLWEYDPSNNTWARRADYTGNSVQYAVGFSIGTKGYICTGRDASLIATTKNLFEYDPLLNTWTQKANYPGDGKFGAIGFVVADKAYVGIGDYNENDIWEYTQSTNTWLRKADFPGTGRVLASAFTIGSDGYVGLGQGGAYQDLWKYGTANNSWTRMTDIDGSGRYAALGVSVGTSGFIAGGTFGFGEPGDVWEYTGATTSVPLLSQSGLPSALAINNGGWTKVGNNVYQSGTGNVGIGTTTPESKLHLAGSLKIFDGTQGASKVLTSDANGLASWQALPVIPANAWTASGNNIFNNNTANVGIGTSTPNSPISFANTVGNKISLWGSSSTSNYGLGVQSGLLQLYTDAPAANIAFGSGSSSSFTEIARIINSGEYGMSLKGRLQLTTGTQSSGLWMTNIANTQNVTFMGMAADNLTGFYSPGGAGWGLTMNTSNANVGIGLNGGNPTKPLSFPASLGEKILLYPGGVGEVGIGVYGGELRLHCDIPGGKVSFGTQDNAGNFDQTALAQRNGVFAFSVLGSLWVNGTTYASDERFKQNITSISSPLEKLLQINGVEYEMKTTEFAKNNFQPGRQMGLLAQNVEKIVPEAVNEKDGYKGVDYARLVPLLIESIKELKREIEELKAK